jgi:DNA polymerase-3 subunit delta
MKVPAARAGAFVKKPDSAVQVLLIYGDDRGQVRELADTATQGVVEDMDDPFRIVRITAGVIADDPARLADEAAAIPFGGGRRVVRIESAGDAHTKHLKSFLDAPMGDGLIVVEAAYLGSRSTLRKLAETAKNAAALPCFADEGKSLDEVIRETMQGHGLSVSAEARAYLATNLGSDRQVTRGELDKLALYAGGRGEPDAPISLDDAAAAVGDSSALTMDNLTYAVSGGDNMDADRALGRLFRESTNAVTILRGLGRHFVRLQAMAVALARGVAPDAAARGLQPPAFGPRARQLAAQARSWPADAINQAIIRIDDTEAQCKTTGAPDELLCGRLVLSLSAAAAVRKRRQGG